MTTNPYSSAATLVKSAHKIATPPKIFQEINKVLGSTDSTVADIADIISRDPGVSARVLQVVNSAYYSLPNKIETISEGVKTLGTRQLRDLVLATTVMKQFDGLSEELIDLEQFWHHCLACAVTTQVLAEFRKEPNLETYFVAGLLHDLGRLVMYAKMPEQCNKMLERCQESQELILNVEKDIFGFDHTEVGTALLESWNMPINLIEVAGCHHLPQKATSSVMMSSIVHIADILVHALGIGNSGEQFIPSYSPLAWSQFGMNVTLLPKISEEVEKRFSEMVSIFNNDMAA